MRRGRACFSSCTASAVQRLLTVSWGAVEVMEWGYTPLDFMALPCQQLHLLRHVSHITLSRVVGLTRLLLALAQAE